MNIGGQLPGLDVPGAEGETAIGEEPGEHLRIVALLAGDFRGRMAGLENADLHGNLLFGRSLASGSILGKGGEAAGPLRLTCGWGAW